jgi:hypothetical protein
MTVLGAGCMVTGSPEFAEPKPTRPYLAAQKPVTWAIKVVPGVGSPAVYALDGVTFDVVSEDLNKNLFAVLFLDYRGPVAVPSTVDQPFHFVPVVIAPGHLDPTSVANARPVEYPYTLPTGTPAGCHSLTVLVTHDFKVGGVDPMDDKDVGTLTWWLAVQDQFTMFDPASCIAVAGTGDVDGGTP